MYICIYMYTYMYIYICIERERDRTIYRERDIDRYYIIYIIHDYVPRNGGRK